MPGFNPDKINIHDLTVEEPEKETESSSAVFDPERDISNEDWQKWRDEFVGSMRKAEHIGDKTNCLDSAVPLKILFPERSEELEIGEDTWRMLSEIYDTETRVEHTSDSLFKMKILFPEKFKDIKFNSPFDKIKWDSMAGELNRKREDVLKESYLTNPFTELAMKLKIIFPEKTNELGLDDDVAEKLKECIKGERDRNSWYNFLINASNFKILYPEKANEINLDADFWEKAKHALHTDCQGMNPSFFAACLKILVADRVEITDEGLKFVMPEKKEKSSFVNPEMPEQRKF